MTMDVIKRVAALPTRSTTELRRLWQELNRTEAPPYNKAFLVRRLAYRLQELAYGGLPGEVLERLEVIAEQDGEGPNKRVANAADRPVAGTRLVREWKGVEHCVTVLDDGYEYQGRRFRSLSGAARAITGTQWNGRVFFYGARGKGGGR